MLDKAAPGSVRERSRIAQTHGGEYPACEYCGRSVFPGEEQELDHCSLVWHSAHCFRCFGCHREFHEERPWHLLTHIALCEDCYPRREFLMEEWRSLTKGGNFSHKQGRVCFLSPVINSRSKNDYPHGFEMVFDDVPDQLATLEARNRNRNRGPVGPPGDEAVIAQIADAMQTEVEPLRLPTRVEAPTGIQGAVPKNTSREKVVVDERFRVITVDDWGGVGHESLSETEYFNTCESGARSRLSSGSATSSGAQLEDNVPSDIDVEVDWRRSRRALRRTSSCSDLYQTRPPNEPLTTPPLQAHDSNLLDDDVEFRSFPDPVDREEVETVRAAYLCSSPALTPHSSTPIPGNAQGCISNDRPPSSSCGNNAYAPIDISRASTISLQDTSVDRNDLIGGSTGELPSFQEIRARFQRKPEGTPTKTCCTCGGEVLPMERFECLHQVYHPRCFRCSTCKVRLNPQTFRDDGRQPFCKTCFLDLRVSKNSLPHWRKSLPARPRVNSL